MSRYRVIFVIVINVTQTRILRMYVVIEHLIEIRIFIICISTIQWSISCWLTWWCAEQPSVEYFEMLQRCRSIVMLRNTIRHGSKFSFPKWFICVRVYTEPVFKYIFIKPVHPKARREGTWKWYLHDLFLESLIFYFSMSGPYNRLRFGLFLFL